MMMSNVDGVVPLFHLFYWFVITVFDIELRMLCDGNVFGLFFQLC